MVKLSWVVISLNKKKRFTRLCEWASEWVKDKQVHREASLLRRKEVASRGEKINFSDSGLVTPRTTPPPPNKPYQSQSPQGLNEKSPEMHFNYKNDEGEGAIIFLVLTHNVHVKHV